MNPLIKTWLEIVNQDIWIAWALNPPESAGDP